MKVLLVLAIIVACAVADEPNKTVPCMNQQALYEGKTFPEVFGKCLGGKPVCVETYICAIKEFDLTTETFNGFVDTIAITPETAEKMQEKAKPCLQEVLDAACLFKNFNDDCSDGHTVKSE